MDSPTNCISLESNEDKREVGETYKFVIFEVGHNFFRKDLCFLLKVGDALFGELSLDSFQISLSQ
jgi:hypothetical protein